MKIKWLVTDVTAVGSPDIAKGAILGMLLGGDVFLVNSGGICGWGAPL